MIIRKANLFKCVFFMDDDVSYSNYISAVTIEEAFKIAKEYRPKALYIECRLEGQLLFENQLEGDKI